MPLSRREFRGKASSLSLSPADDRAADDVRDSAGHDAVTRRTSRLASSVVLLDLVPIVPFVILILMPFIEQVGVNLESAAKMLGARRLTVFQQS